MKKQLLLGLVLLGTAYTNLNAWGWGNLESDARKAINVAPKVIEVTKEVAPVAKNIAQEALCAEYSGNKYLNCVYPHDGFTWVSNSNVKTWDDAVKYCPTTCKNNSNMRWYTSKWLVIGGCGCK